MTHYFAGTADAWQESWDLQQQAYMPDREHRIATMLDAVAAVTEGHPRLLDLAGGTGSIALRTLARDRHAEVTVVDQDPVLLTLAAASLADRATIVTADLRDPSWRAALPHDGYDAVLTATALHWLPSERLTTLYAEIREALRPGGIFANADQMPDDGLPGLTKRLMAAEDSVRNTRYATGASVSWRDWWARVAADPQLAPLYAEREKVYPADHGAAEWLPPAGWHLEALRAAGFTECGLLWRGAVDAAVVAVR